MWSRDVPDFGRCPGVMKTKKRIMEGFKRAFSAPWPKTLRYQVMVMRRTGIALQGLKLRRGCSRGDDLLGFGLIAGRWAAILENCRGRSDRLH